MSLRYLPLLSYAFRTLRTADAWLVQKSNATDILTAL